MRGLPGVVLAFLLLAGCGNPSAYSPERAVPTAVAGKIVFIGDSLTAGIPGYPSYATRLIGEGLDAVNVAIGGTTSTFWAQMLMEKRLDSPRLVFVMLGTNDGISAREYRENIARIVASVSCPVILITTPPVYNDAMNKGNFVARYAEVCRELDPQAIDLWASPFTDSSYIADGIHFTESGQEIIYRLVRERLQRLGLLSEGS